jgi:hypothetical protein
MIANLLWLSFWLGVLLGLVAMRVSDKRLSWQAAILATILLLAFSWGGGLSIGPLTIALPVLLTAMVVTQGMAAAPRIVVIAGAAAAYWLATWGLGPMRQANPEAPILLTGFCAASYLVALVYPRFRPSERA